MGHDGNGAGRDDGARRGRKGAVMSDDPSASGPEHAKNDVELPALREGSTAFGSLTRDWLTPGPRSEWTRRVTQARILNQDRIRPFVTRGLLLVALAACLVALGAPLGALMWLGLGVLQTGLEIALERTMRSQYEQMARAATDRTSAISRQIRRSRNLIVRVWYWNFERGITNVTGLIGAVAAAGNLVVVVVFTTSDGNPEWLRVLALAIATAYMASGALGPLADVAMYSPATTLPAWLTFALRWLWVGVVGLILGVILAGEGTTWAWGDSVPYAVLAVIAIGYYPMLRCREFERAMAASHDVSEQMTAQRYATIALELHNLLQPVKDTLHLAAQAVPNPADKAEIEMFLRDMRYVYKGARDRTIDLTQGLGMPLEDHLKAIASAGRVRLRAELDVPSDLAPEHRARVRQWLLALVHNSVQACRSWPHNTVPLVQARAHAMGTELVLSVSDPLDQIPDDVWDDPDATLRKIRHDVSSVGGSMTQGPSDPDGLKTVTVRWAVIDPLRRRIEGEGR